MKTEDVLLSIKKSWFVKPLCLKQFPFISKMSTPPEYKFFKEVTVRIPTGNTTRYGKPNPQRRRFDAVMLVKPHYQAYRDDLLTIGIENKCSKTDLIGDKKYTDYLGYTNYFFFCVPASLVGEAEKKLTDERIGILDATNEVIVRYPVLQTVSTIHAESLLRQIAFTF